MKRFFKGHLKRTLAILTIMALLVPSACFGAVTNMGSYYFWDGNGYYSYSQSPYEISIIYTGDMKGNLVNSKGGDVAKAMTKIAQLRRYYPDSYLLDAGNFMGKDNSFGSKITQSYELKALETMAYDAAALGEKELSNAPDTLKSFLESAIKDKVNTKDYMAYPKLLCSNISWKEVKGGSFVNDLKKITPDLNYTIVEKFKSKLAVLSVTEPDKALQKQGYELGDPAESVNSLVSSIKKKNGDLNGVVVLYNGGENGDATNFASDLKGVDLVISADDSAAKGQNELIADYKPQKAGKALVVKTSGTEAVGHLVFTVEGNKLTVQKCQNYKLDKTDFQNPAITNIENQYNRSVDKSYFGLFGFSQNQKLTYNGVDFGTIGEGQGGINEGEGQGQGGINEGLGYLISDAYKYTGALYAKDPDQVAGAFFAAGTLKNSLGKGNVYVKNVYNMFDKDYGTDGLSGKELVNVYVTGAELKILAEIDASITEDNKDVALYASGIYYEYNPNRFARNKVSNVWLGGKNKTEVDGRSLYRVITDVDTIKLIDEANKAPFGLMDVEFKDKDGNPLENVEDAIIMQGSHPLKQWVAVAKYVGNKGITTNYGHPNERKILNDDSSIKAIFQNPGKVFIVTTLAAIIAIALIILIIAAIIGLIKKALGISNSAFYRNARKANKQKSIFKHRKNRYKRNMKYRKESWFSRKFRK